MEQWLITQGPTGMAILVIVYLAREVKRIQDLRVAEAQAHSRAALEAIKALQDLGLIQSNRSKTATSTTPTQT